MDWDNARIFLAIGRAGTLRGAAALLRIDQATCGRRLAALESSLGATPVPAHAVGLCAHAGRRTGADGGRSDGAGGRQAAARDAGRRQPPVRPGARGHHRHHGQPFRHRAPCSACTRPTRTSASCCSVAPQLASLTRREADLAVRGVRPHRPGPDLAPPGQAQPGPVCLARLPGRTRRTRARHGAGRPRHRHLPPVR